MPISKLPDIRDSNNKDELLGNVLDAYYKLKKELEYLLVNLDEENVLRAGSVYAENIDTINAKIKVGQIETLTVGGNVIMGENATISWSQVTGTEQVPLRTDITWSNLLNKPTNLLTQPQLEDALTDYVTTGIMTDALADTLNLGNFSTIITKNYIASMNLAVGNEILMGSNARIAWNQVTSQPHIPTTSEMTQITANYISTPNLVTNIAQVNKTLNLGGALDTGQAINFGTTGGISTDQECLIIGAFSRIVLSSNWLDLTEIGSIDWGSNAPSGTAKFV